MWVPLVKQHRTVVDGGLQLFEQGLHISHPRQSFWTSHFCNFASKHNSTLTSEEEVDEDGLWVSWGRPQEGGRSCRSRLISSMSDIPSVELQYVCKARFRSFYLSGGWFDDSTLPRSYPESLLSCAGMIYHLSFICLSYSSHIIKNIVFLPYIQPRVPLQTVPELGEWKLTKKAWTWTNSLMASTFPHISIYHAAKII